MQEELKVLTKVTKLLDTLTPDQQHRAVHYVSAAYHQKYDEELDEQLDELMKDDEDNG